MRISKAWKILRYREAEHQCFVSLEQFCSPFLTNMFIL
jgi:hypothetical protein